MSPGPELEKRILDGIRPRRHTAGWWAAAAAILLMLGIGPLFRLRQAPEKAPVASVQSASMIKDTYDDPEQALAAVRKALLTASKKMNKGLRPIK
jgi:hypothetical protein